MFAARAGELVAVRVRADAGVRAADAPRRRRSAARSRRRRRRRSPTSRASCRSRSRSRGSCSARRWGAPTSSPTGSKASRSLLADLEVRQRMAGRWMMASIQTTFAVMPAAVYWFGGLALAHGSHAISRADARRVHDAADAALLPGRLAARRRARRADARSRSSTASSSTSTSRSTSRSGPARARSSAAGDVAFDDVWFRYGDGRLDARRTSRSRCRPGRRRRSSARRARARRRSATSPRASTTSNEGSVSIDGVDVRDLTFASLARLVGVVSQETYLFHATRAREPALREARRDRRGDRGGGRRGADPRADRVAARGLRHRRRRARLPLLGRREAADRDRAHDPAQPADPRARRGDELARHRDRAAGAGGARPARRGPHDDRDRPPPLDRRATPTRSSSSTAAAIVERGTHDELLALGGRYAELVGRARPTESPSSVSRLRLDGDFAPRRRSPAPPRVDEGARAVAERQLLRREEADPRRAAAHDLRGGALPEHRRVLGPRHRDVPDPRRDLHARLPLLLRQLGQAERAGRPARAAAARADGEADGAEARRRHVGRPRRRPRQGRRPLRGDDPRDQGEAARGDRSRC